LACLQVDGVYDCDPVKNPDAKLHRRLSFRQVCASLPPLCCVLHASHPLALRQLGVIPAPQHALPSVPAMRLGKRRAVHPALFNACVTNR